MKFNHFYKIIPNRVRRNYRGGYFLDQCEGKMSPVDGDYPEDWLASTTLARNPGMPVIKNEGLTSVVDSKGMTNVLRDMIARKPEYFLGRTHLNRNGMDLGFLAKLLDSSIRLHVQAHPTARFAQEHLNSRWGKLETYVILNLRQPEHGYIRLGFQRSPTPKEWRRIVEEQDITAMNACFDKIPVQVGQIWVVPGGMPHAIGEGVSVLEVMEPTDMVVRCEYEREGIVVPPEARYVGMTPEQAFEMFDYTSRSSSEIRDMCRIFPKLLIKKNGLSLEELIGEEQTNCFCVYRTTITQNNELYSFAKITVCLVTKGTGQLNTERQTLMLKPGVRFLLPAKVRKIHYAPESGEELEILSCTP